MDPRFNAGEFAHFLRYSRGSLAEAERRLRAGVRKGYWTDAAAEPLHHTAFRLGRAIKGFREYLLKRKKVREKVRDR